MKKKKLVVTGGLGFIGSNLVIQLVKLNYFVIIIDKKTYSSNLMNLSSLSKKSYSFFKKDINDKKFFSKILKKFKPIGIFNLAAETHVDRSIDDPNLFIKSNVNGVFSLLQCIKSYLKKGKKLKLIHVSTDEVYGDIKKNKFSKESDPYRPSSPYAASKAASDHLVSAYYKTYNLPLIITNCCNNYGPRQFPEKLIPKLILNLINKKSLPLYGKGLNEREWIHVEDHCKALVQIFKKGKIGESYNIGSGEIFKNNYLAKKLITLFRKKKILSYKSVIQYIKDRPGHDKRYALNSKKIKKLNWKKNYSIDQGLNHTVDWYLKNKKWIKKLVKKNYQSRMGLKID